MRQELRSDRWVRYVSLEYRRLLLVVILLGIAFRVGAYYALKAADPGFNLPALDSQAYMSWARRIAAGHLLGGTKPFFLNPLYAYFLAPIASVTGHHFLLAVRVVQGLLGLGTVLLVASATRRLFGEGIALLAALFAAAWPLLLYYEQSVMIVTLAVFVNALLVLVLARFRTKPAVGGAFLAGLVLGVATLARPNVALFGVFLPFWFLYLAPEEKGLRFVSTRTAALVLGAALAISPVTVRNWWVGHDFVPVTSSMGVNLYVSNNPRAWKTGRMVSSELRANPHDLETDSTRIAQTKEGRKLRPSEVSAYWVRRTLKTVERSPGKAAVFLARKFLYFFAGYEEPSSHPFSFIRERTPFLHLNPLSFAILSPLALLGFLIVCFRRREGVFLVLLFAAYAIGLTIFFPLGHYRAPVLPAAFPLGALGLACLARPAVDLHVRELATVALGFVLCLAVSNGTAIAKRLGVPSLSLAKADPVTLWYNMGETYLRRRDYVSAERAFEKARDLDGKQDLPYLGLADLARARGEPANERRNLEKALDLEPGSPRARVCLGRNLFEAGEKKRGLSMAEQALREAPNDVPSMGVVGNLYVAEGRVEEGLRTFQRANRLSGGSPQALSAIADCQIRLKRYAEAKETIEKGFSLDPSFPYLHFEMAKLMIAGGKAGTAEIARQVRAGRDLGGNVPPELSPYLETGTR